MRVLFFGINCVLQDVDNIIGIGQCVGVNGCPGLVNAVCVTGREQAQKDIASGSPITMDDIVALSGRRPKLTGRTGDGHSVNE